MTRKESLEWQAKEQTFLNTIDLIPYLQKDKNISDIMDLIEDAYNDEYTEEEYIFNCMDHWDFIKYLKKRYPNFQYYEYSECRVARI